MIDYEAIRERSLYKYGHEDDHLSIFERLYADRTHFIFELVQNAEDANATELTFELFGDRLEVRHDGRLFNEADVEGICGIGKSTKAEDFTKIGRFGIGFKSVYAYTREPTIHSGNEHFSIRTYVRPYAATPRPISQGETLFVFPFDHPDMTPRQAHAEVRDALNGLRLETLLFVRSIARIHVLGEGLTEALLGRRESARSTHSSQVELTQICDDEQHCHDQTWMVWSRPVEASDGDEVRVQVAFSADAEDGQLAIRRIPNSPLVVFFPTERETSLGFLVQGPYRTTPARDNIPQRDPWNQRLVAETAALLSSTLCELRDNGLLQAETLACLPLDPLRFSEYSMFRPLYDACLAAFQREDLIPTADGGYARSADVRLARSQAVRDLVAGERFSKLFDAEHELRWVSGTVSAKKTPEFHRYLREQLAVGEVTAESVVQHLTGQFLSDESDEWIVRLYEMLDDAPHLWRRDRRSAEPLAATLPLVRLDDGTHVLPFDDKGSPLAYMPTDSPTEFPTVRSQVIGSDKAKSFLRGLGLKQPDITAEVLELVLPRYTSGAVEKDNIDWEAHDRDLDKIARALEAAQGPRLKRLHEDLRSACLIASVNCDGDWEFRPAQDVCLATPQLEIFFEGNSAAWFAHNRYEEWRSLLLSLGARVDLAPDARSAGRDLHVNLDSNWGWHRRGRDGFDPGATLDGLQFALSNPNLERSRMIWNEVLVPYSHLVAGVVETCTRQNYSGSSTNEAVSPMGRLSRELAWLPSPSGGWSAPVDLAPEDIPEGFDPDPKLAEALGMVRSPLLQVAEELGVSAEDLRMLQDPEQRADWEEFKAKQARQRSAATRPDAEGPQLPSIDYASALVDAVARPAKMQSHEEPDRSGGKVSNPAFRRERVRSQIQGDREAEPDPSQRFRRISRKVWEQKDKATRDFIAEQYGGHCQICDDSFRTRKGSPYFEAAYMVSRTEVRWIDRAGNVLCLCATCCAKFEHGAIEADDILDQVTRWRPESEGGSAPPELRLLVCGAPTTIRFTEKHFLDLQEMVVQS